MNYFSITSDSKLAHRGKKGLITYIHKNGTWKKTGTTDETNAKMLQRKWDQDLFCSDNGLVNRNKLWADWKKDYTKNYETDNRQTTAVEFKRSVKCFERIVFGGNPPPELKLVSITPEDADLFKSVRLSEVKPQSFKNDLSRLAPMFEKARRRKYIDTSPFEDVTCPAPKFKKEQKFLRVAEADACLAWVEKKEPHYALLARLAYETGMRRSEIIHVRIEDVSFTTKILNLRQHEECSCFHCAKTEKGEWLGKAGVPREIPLTDDVCATLLSIYDKQKEGIVFKVSASRVSSLFQRAFERSGVGGNAHTHTFRHTMATDMERAGVRRGVQMDIIGHNGTTTDGYVHATIEELHDGLRKLQAWRQGQRPTLKTTEINGVEVLEATA